MEIEKVMIPIEKIINNSEECFAHVAKDNKQKETLKEHTECNLTEYMTKRTF